ncbi:CysQ 3'-Phosphoadenosine 5'-phosphosulfate (PAPS) 3'-phosphatase [Burkholderiaceae bacterium]
MHPAELTPIVDPLLQLAKTAGERIMAIYHAKDIGQRLKDDQSPVTLADLAAHNCLAPALKQLADWPVVSEEDAASLTFRTTASRFWLIDPLDGTKEFIAKNGEFTVNIALIDQGRSVLGVVYAPVLDLLYWGGPALGAYRRQVSCTQVISVAHNKSEQTQTQPCRVVASKSHLNEQTRKFIEQLGAVSLIQAGSSLKFCRVAEGAADIYPRLAPTCEWDTAAAQAVLEGAGGVVLDFNSLMPLCYGKPEVLNPSFVATRDIELIPK